MRGGHVLVVEDEPILGRNMATFLQRRGHHASLAETVALGLKRYGEMQPDVILVDHNLPDGTGLSLIEEIRSADRWTKLVMVTAHGGVELAVKAMKAGADDYLTKPVSLDEIGVMVEKMLEQARVTRSLAYFQRRDQGSGGLSRIIGSSSAIQEMKRRIQFMAAAERKAATGSEPPPGPPVLILGETGTGKELVARAVHLEGPRADKPFIGINCAALPEHLVESELFGHERGAFSGATERKVGLFQAAEGGTLFLDEVGELPLAQQAKLLRALEDRVIRPVGSVRDRAVDVRIVAATNASLEERTQQGEFRSDLYYRLNTITVGVPPLRERGDDIIMIAHAFVAEFERRYSRTGLQLTEAARSALRRHAWPGNIRELRNVLEQACMMSARNAIDVADLALRELPPLSETPSAGDASLGEVERSLIVNALRQNQGNVTSAARALGISRDTLRYRMEKHALRREYYT
ncbi:MAG: sigma-54 dependent transcriptional regulator [Alsobacter sp.]